MSPLPEPGIEKLDARRGDPAMPAGRPVGGFHWIAASSTRASGSDARALGSPVELNDGDVATAWAEGMGGDGRGEFVTARSTAGGYAVRGLRVFPGDGASLDAFRGKNRVRRFQIAFGPAREQRFDVEIPGDPTADAAHWRDPFWVPLPKPMAGVVRDRDRHRGGAGQGGVAARRASAPPRSASWRSSPSWTAPRAPSAWSPTWWARPTARRGCRCWSAWATPAVLPTAQAVMGAKGFGRECLIEGLTTLEPAPKSPVVLEALAAAVAGATDKEERLVTAALSRAGDGAGVAAGGAAVVGEGAGSRTGRARRACSGRWTTRAPRTCWSAPSGAGPRRCGRRWSARSAARPSCAARRC